MQLTLLPSETEGTVRISSSGRITQEAVAAGEDPIERLAGSDAYSRRLLLDLSGSDYMDSSGVSWLLRCHKRCKDRGGMLVIHSLAPMVLQILKVLRMDQVFSIAPDEKSARALASREASA